MERFTKEASLHEIATLINENSNPYNAAMSVVTSIYQTLTEMEMIEPDKQHDQEFRAYLQHKKLIDKDVLEAYFNIFVCTHIGNDHPEYFDLEVYQLLYDALYGESNDASAPVPLDLPVKQLLLIEIIGSSGKYEKADIYKAFNEWCITRNLADKQLTDGSCLFHMNKLIHDKFIKQEKTAHPLKSQYCVYSLTEKGRQTYTHTFGQPPVEPLFAEIIRAHDNLKHGLGIVELEKLLNESHEYFLVSCDRKDTTIALRDGRTYIPDIIVKGHSSGRQAPFTAYFEYELNTHTQENFEEKMERALQTLWQEDCVKCIYIVTNNHENAMDLSKKVDKWVEKRGISLMSIRLRITTLVCIREAVQKSIPVNNMGNWIVSYNFQKGAKPKIIKPQITFNQKKSKA